MDTARIVLLVIVALVVVLPAVQLARMGWRIVRGTDEFVAGGSMGHQMTSPIERRRFRRRRRQ